MSNNDAPKTPGKGVQIDPNRKPADDLEDNELDDVSGGRAPARAGCGCMGMPQDPTS